MTRNTSPNKSELMLIDSGATFSIFSHKHLFTSLRPADADDEMFDAQDQPVTLAGKGIVELDLGRVVRLEAYLSDDVSGNIISTTQLERFGIYPDFKTRHLRDQDGNEVTNLIKAQDAYWLSPDKVIRDTHRYRVMNLTAATRDKISLQQLHESFSHTNVKYIKKSLELGLIKDMNIDDVDWRNMETFKCEPCLSGKGKRHSHIAHSRETYQAKYGDLEFLHTDIFGPMHRMPKGTPKYFITFTDEKSRYRWALPLIHKDEDSVLDHVENLIANIYCQHGVRVKAVQMDQGSEYTNSSIKTYFAKKGIDTYYTTVADSASHGVAERLNLTLLNDCRTLLAGSGMPRHLWFEAVKVACHHRNSLYNPKIGTSPRMRIGLDTIRANRMPRFGQPCMVHNPRAIRHKLQARSIPGFILRRSNTSYGHRVYIPSTHTIVDTRNFVLVDQHSEPISDNENSLELYNSADSEDTADDSEEESDYEITPPFDDPSAREYASTLDQPNGLDDDMLDIEAIDAPIIEKQPVIPIHTPQKTPDTYNVDVEPSHTTKPETQKFTTHTTGNNIAATPESIVQVAPDRHSSSEGGTQQPPPTIIVQEMGPSRFSSGGGSSQVGRDPVEQHPDQSEESEVTDYSQEENGEDETEIEEERDEEDDEEIVTNEDIFAELTKNPLPKGSRKRKGPITEEKPVPMKRKRIHYLRAIKHKADIAKVTEKSLQYREAITKNNNIQEKDEYKAAYNKEIDQLEKHKTWDVSNPINEDSVPKERIVSSMFIFTTKRDGRRKCRCVARGDRQKPETYDPDADTYTVAHEALTTCLAISLDRGWTIKQLDITSAYLYAPLKEELYIKTPPHYGLRNKVFKLEKSLYGLKQSGSNWYEVIKEYLTTTCKLVEVDMWPCVLMRSKGKDTLVVNLFVDDMIVMTSNEKLYDELLGHLQKRFETKVVADGIPDKDGFARYDILGLEIEYKRYGKMLIGMEKTIIEKLPKLGLKLEGKKDRKVPGQPGQILDVSDKELMLSKEEFDKKVHHLQKIVGLLSYITHKCRFEMSYYVNVLAQHTLFPCDEVFDLATQCVQYLWNNKHKKLNWTRSENVEEIKVEAITDASHATQEEYKSQLGYFYKINDKIIFARSAKSTISCVSSTEAELNALFNAVPKLKSIQHLVENLKFRTQVKIFTDSQTLIASITKTNVSKFRSRFFGSKAYRLRQDFEASEFQVEYVKTDENTADILTKPLAVKIFQKHISTWMM